MNILLAILFGIVFTAVCWGAGYGAYRLGYYLEGRKRK